MLAAAFWTVPNILVLDEPTNYLDREVPTTLRACRRRQPLA